MRPPFAPTRLTGLVALADEILRRTVRWRVDDPHGALERARAGQSMIFACRHGQLWPLLWAVRGCGLTILASRSSDGELLARVLEGRGFDLVRGSSSRDGLPAAREALRVLRSGGRLGLAVDGPRGPRGVVQDGPLRLARSAGVPLIPLRVSGSPAWVAPGSWDAFEIPRPGGRLVVDVRPPVEVGPGALGLDAAGARLAAELGGRRAGRQPVGARPAPFPAAGSDLG